MSANCADPAFSTSRYRFEQVCSFLVLRSVPWGCRRDAGAMQGSATRTPSVVRVAWAGPRLSAHALQVLGERHLPAIHVDGSFQCRSHPGVAGQCGPLGRRQRVVGVPATAVGCAAPLSA